MHGDGSQPTRLTDDAFRDEQPGISPDGTRIAFVSARDPGLGDLDIWIMGADGSAQSAAGLTARRTRSARSSRPSGRGRW